MCLNNSVLNKFILLNSCNVLQEDLASQPTISRFENSLDKHSIFNILNAWVDNYVSSLRGKKEITIDVDATNNPTHESQQLSLFNGYYGQFMYNELFFHDGDTGQIILPVLRLGNSHSNKWSPVFRILTPKAKKPT